MYKAPDIYFNNRKQKDDSYICRDMSAVSDTHFTNIKNNEIKISEQEAEQSLQNQVNTFYHTINSSQSKELTKGGSIKLSSHNDKQCKSNKIQYKTNCVVNSEKNNASSMFMISTGTWSSTSSDKNCIKTDKVETSDCFASDNESSDSEFSSFSGLSELSGQEWEPTIKSLTWVQKQIHSGANPREILSQILSNGATIAPSLNDMSLWRILFSMLSEPPRRQKLRHINTIDDILQLLKVSKNIIVLTGAGVSVSCGIPDFRSNDGIYSRLAKDFPDLPDPQAMFDISYFSRDPRPFYKFAKEIYPGQFKPSPCHRFIKLLEKKQKLLRNYTQNIDTLEQLAGIQNVIECHGSFATASCTKCKYKTTADFIRNDIFEQRIPLCPKCHENSSNYEELLKAMSYSELVQSGIMKPDIVFFGEGLPEEFHLALANDKDKCDLLIVIGSSLKVRPVALIPCSIPIDVPQILINRERLNHLEFDVELLGDSDIVINQLCHLLGDDWTEICWNTNILVESRHLKLNSFSETNLSNSTLDADSQSIKSIITQSSNSSGILSDSGYENSSSLHNIQTSEKLVENILNVEQQKEEKQNEEMTTQDTLFLRLLSENNKITLLDKFNKESIHLRHLSVDSSKDSGISESLNSYPVSICKNLCNVEELDDTQDREESEKDSEYGDNYHKIQETISTQSKLTGSYVYKSSNNSIADRLYENTYYYHSSSSSYVFPGAQVYWSSDSEEEDDEDKDIDDDDDKDGDHDDDGDIDGKTNENNEYDNKNIEIRTKRVQTCTDNSLNNEGDDNNVYHQNIRKDNNNGDDDCPPNKKWRKFSFIDI